MKKLILSLVLTVAFSALAAGSALASVSCQPIYGGGQTCTTTATNISINKTVQNPKTGQYVENLGVTDTRFSPGQDVSFQFTVTNTGANTISKANIKDIFPQYVNFVSGPGKFDTNSKTLSFELDNLAAGQSQTYTIVGKVSTDSAITQNNGIICVVNQASAQIVSDGQTASDNAQLCIQKEIVTATTKGGLPVLPAPKIATTPATGPEMAVLPLLSGSGILGWFLRRKSSK